MSRALIGAKCRHCRRAGMKLFLKGSRCQTEKCSAEKRNYPPGQHGKRRSKPSEYALQLREKQKLKKIYGVMEKQFHNYFKKASQHKGVTGLNLLLLLECRFDNMIYRSGFTSSRLEARQLVRHGHFLINGQRRRISSFFCRAGDKISVYPKQEKITEKIKETFKKKEEKGVTPPWIKVEPAGLTAEILRLPEREEMGLPIKEQLVVELYSK